MWVFDDIGHLFEVVPPIYPFDGEEISTCDEPGPFLPLLVVFFVPRHLSDGTRPRYSMRCTVHLWKFEYSVIYQISSIFRVSRGIDEPSL